MRTGTTHQALQRSQDAAKPQRPALGAGKPLPMELRTQMEARFGADFGRVRIHDQPSAQELAQQQLAQAFTFGNHIAFNRGRFAPGTRDGKLLLAHELAHVVQQSRGGAAMPPLQGGPLERAADSAASAVVGGSGPVQVGGASAVGIARQPLPQEEQYGPPPPRSLSISLVKNEEALPDAALRREVGLIQAWLDFHPLSAERDHLAAELNLLLAEDLARTGRRSAQAAAKPKPKEGSLATLTGIVHKGRLEAEEVEAAQRIYEQTGKIPQTTTPFSWAEIKRGEPLSRSRRYDLMMLKQGKPYAEMGDLLADNRDPEFLSPQEFKDEFKSRVDAEKQRCDDDHWFRGPTYDCERDVDAKYGGPGFRAWREEREWRLFLQIQAVSQKIEAVRDSGPIATLGRAAGYGYGALTGQDRLAMSEKFAAVSSLGDSVVMPALAARTTNARQMSYAGGGGGGGGGHVVRRDAATSLVEPRSSGPTPLPPTEGPAKSAAQALAPSTAIPIESGKGLPTSDASKALAAALARQSPKNAGSITALPVRKPDPPAAPEPTQQKMPAVAAVEEKVAVGQTHGAGGAAAPRVDPATSIAGAGAQGMVASLKTSRKSSAAATGSVKPGTTAASTSTARAAAVPINATGGRGTNTERMVAVRVEGGGSAGKGTYVVEGTPEFEAAAKDKRYSVMPESWAISNKSRPVGTPFDPAIEPLKIGGVQVESNGAGTGKGSKHNISARAGVQASEKANAATYGKTVGASVAEAHGQKTLVDGGEVVLIRPGNASTGGVDSITADVGRTANTIPAGKAAPAVTADAPGRKEEVSPKVFLNDFTGPKTSKSSKATHANWVGELRDAVVHPLFGFNSKAFDDAVYDAIQKGEVYVRVVRVENTPQGTKVTRLPPSKVHVPASVKKDVANARQKKP